MDWGQSVCEEDGHSPVGSGLEGEWGTLAGPRPWAPTPQKLCFIVLCSAAVWLSARLTEG